MEDLQFDQSAQSQQQLIEPLVFPVRTPNTTSGVGSLNETIVEDPFTRTDSNLSRTSLYQTNKRVTSIADTQKKRENIKQRLAKAEVVLQLTLVDKASILVYNSIEPCLLALIMGTAMQISEIGTALYMVISFLAVLPWLLTNQKGKIINKFYAAVLMVALCPILLFMKIWIYCQLTETKHLSANMEMALGVFPNQWTKTFLNDILVLVFSGMLVLHYVNQLKHAEARLTYKKNLMYQTAIKLHHPYFDKCGRGIFIVAYSLFFVDTLVYQTFVQLVILIVLLRFLHMWSTGRRTSRQHSERILKVMQTVSFLFIGIAFLLRMPGILHSFQINHSQLMQSMGLESVIFANSEQFQVLSIFHRIILSFAVVTTQAFLNRAQHYQAYQQHQPSQVGLEEFDPSQMVQSPLVATKRARRVAETAQPKPLTKASSKKQKKELTWQMIWDQIYIPIMLWLCRIFCFIQAYRYHDYQSLVPLAFIIHSSLFQSRQNFIWWILWLYLPLLYACYLWYFVVNIFDLVQYSDWDTNKTQNNYLYGFYKFKNPELELPLCLSALICICTYVRLNKLEIPPPLPLMATIKQFSPTVHSYLYLMIVDSYVLICIYLVIFSMVIMNLFHIFVLIIMVFAVYYPDYFARKVVWLVGYAGFMLASMYLFTLIDLSENASLFCIVIGFQTGSYVPNQPKEYWRYSPPFPTWFFLLFAACLYRRNSFIGMNRDEIEKEKSKAEELIGIKNPLTFKVVKYITIATYHCIVLLTFIVFLLTIYLTRRTFMNAVSLLLVLANFGIYMNKGLKPMLKSWKIIQLYQAVVLISIMFVQFFLYTKQEQVSYENITKFWDSISDYSQALWHYTGFYRFPDPLWTHLLPYIVLFFGSIAVEPSFKQKAELDDKAIEAGAIQTQPPVSRTNINASQESQASTPLLTNSRESLDFQIDEGQEVTAEDMKFYLETQRYYDMQHKRSYMIWKWRPLWGVFDFLAINYSYLLMVFVFACSLYFSVALVWFLFLVLFMIQTWYIHRTHMLYQKEQVRSFMARPSAHFVDGNRVTISFNEKRLTRLEEKMIASAEKNRQLREEIEFARQNKAGYERLQFTDEEAAEEYKIYKSEIFKVTLQGREVFWSSNFTLIVVTLILIYISAFIVTPSNETNPETLVPSQYPVLRDKILFLFFWGGFYTETVTAQSLQNYNGAYWPFFTMLFLLFVEKICQTWLRNRFDTSDETIEKFKRIEKEYQQFKRDHLARLHQSSTPQTPQRRPSISQSTAQQDFQPVQITGESRPSIVVIQEPAELLLDQQVQVSIAGRHTFLPNSEEQKQSAQELHNEIYPLIIVKEKLNGDKAMKFLLNELAILLVMMSLIYKQSIISFILFVVLVWYLVNKFRYHGNPMLLIRYVVVALILIQYLMTLTNLTSYNSPQAFPQTLINSTNAAAIEYTVYPNRNQMYFNDPWYFNVTSANNQSVTPPEPEITVSTVYFWGIDVAGRQLSGMWIDFSVVMILYFYLNNFSFWIIKKDFKIVYSEKTKELIQRYRELKRIGPEYTFQQIAKQIKQERTVFRLSEYCRQLLFQNFALIMITFLILTSVFSHSFIALGYFVFSMVLVFNYRNFFNNQSARANQISFLKYILLPYILFDVLFQLVIQIPELPRKVGWIQYIGFVQVWTFTPETLYLGQPTVVTVTINSGTSLTILFLKAVVFFLVLIQVDIVQSASFLKFYDRILFENLKYIKLIGLGLAYRFNNFKNRLLKEQSQNYTHLDKMLREVKKLVKERQMKAKKTKKTSEDPPLIEPPPVQVVQEDEASVKSEVQEPLEVETDIQRRLNFVQEYEKHVYQEYAKRISELNFMFRFYLWLRHNYVQDILFKHSLDHLFEIVEQYREGRTSVRCQIEIGIMITIKEQWLEAQLVEFSGMLEREEISTEQFEAFQTFRRAELAKLALKPWERYDPQTYLSWTKLLSYLFVAFYKVFVSYLELVCYLCMMIAVITNGGILLMVYPALVFGIAMCDEERPGKKFWYFVIFYTQFIILLQYVAQLSIWTDPASKGVEIMNWANRVNLGIVVIQDDQQKYTQLFWLIFPEILILIVVLIHIQCETMAGIFNVSFYDYESFTEGLQRETQNLLDADEKFKKVFQQKQIASRRILVDSLELVESRRKCRSQLDFSELRDSLNETTDLNESRMTGLSTELATDTRPLIQQLLKNPIRVDFDVLRSRSLSADLTCAQQKAKKVTMLNLAMKNAEQVATKFWDNKYFDRLFPRIKQQKPGSDFYVGIAGVMIVIIIYIILAYNMMTLSTSSISQQFSDNQFSGAMVLSMLVMIFIMVVDRYFYSTQSFQNRKVMDKKLDTSSPLLGESSIGKSEDSKSLIESHKTDEEVDEAAGNFQDWMVPQYVPKSPKRVLRYYFLWFVLILIHWYVFFFLTNTKQVCASTPYCNKFTENPYLIWFYLIFCIYFALSAAQIRYGLPELKKGGFMLGNYNAVSKGIYYGWYYTPFLFELRTIIDWTFTATALDVFQSISLAQIQSDMYVAKCYNRPYMEKELGKKISWIEKIGVGLSLMLFILFLIAGPMLLFSSINPVGVANPVASGTLQFYIHLNNPSQGIQMSVPLFDTVQLTKNQTLTSEEYTAMNFSSPASQSDEFTVSQSQVLQFSPISDDVWGITDPKKALLVAALQKTTQENNTSGYYVEGVLQATFTRDSASSATAVFKYAYPLTQAQANFTNTLIDQINCVGNSQTTNQSWPININTTISLNQNKQVYTLDQQYPVTSGVVTSYQCNDTHPSQSYWVLYQKFDDNQTTYNETRIILEAQNGFGFFVFNSDVLPNFLSDYASSVIFFYIAIVYVIASAFRSAFVPLSSEIFIINAPYTEKILMICQCIFIYRVQRNLKNEEELYMILLEIMRSPETIKELSGKSLKKSLE